MLKILKTYIIFVVVVVVVAVVLQHLKFKNKIIKEDRVLLGENIIIYIYIYIDASLTGHPPCSEAALDGSTSRTKTPAPVQVQ